MVEWVSIDNMGTFFGGLTGKNKDDFVDGDAKYITFMNVFSNPFLDVSSTGVVRINEGEKQNKIQKGDILFTGSSETPEDVGMSCVVTDELKEDFYMNSFCFGLRLNNPEQYCLGYLKHIFRSFFIRKEIAKSANGVTRFNISKKCFGKILIPVPPLSEQQRIVSILDTFTSSIDNLKQQIELRKKQYEYYRDQLLDLEGKEGVEMKMLGEVCDYQNGFAFKSNLFKEDGEPIIRITNISSNGVDMSDCKFFDPSDYVKFNLTPFLVDPGDILLAMSGATTGKIGKYGLFKKAYLNQRVGKFIPHASILDKDFLFHYLLGKSNALYIMAGGGAQPNLSSNKLMNEFQIPLPPLSTQRRIVSILDTFESSIRNLEEQLKQRQQQYEYYREKLLTFE